MTMLPSTRGAHPNPRIIQESSKSSVFPSMEGVTLDSPSRLHRRGVVFAHRDLDMILEARRLGSPFGVLTGLMPSGNALGHSMVIDQVKWFQDKVVMLL